MPGILRCNLIKLNEKEIVEKLKKIIKEIISESNSYQIQVSKKYYFKLDKDITKNLGWYAILDGNKQPLYVGKADNLNSRLNTQNGSRDNFANPKRKSDPERNFLKKFADLKIFDRLYVVIIDEQDLCNKLGIKFPLYDIDRANVEKFINLFREFLFK